MPLAGQYDIAIDGGATFSKTFALTSGGVATDLTGFRALMQVRSDWLSNGGTLLASFGTTAPFTGLTIPTPANGQIVLGPIDRTALVNIPADGRWRVYDFFIYQPSGVEERLFYGRFQNRQFATEVP